MAADIPAEQVGPTGVLGATPTPCLLHAAVGEVRPGVQVAMLCVECVRLRPPAAQGDPRATAPAELREAAKRLRAYALLAVSRRRIEAFHAHLDACAWCRANPFALCLAGQDAMAAMGDAAPKGASDGK